MRRKWIPFVFAFATAFGSAGAVDQKLDNGLRVILIPHRANPMVASAVLVGAGVVDEPAEASGASHFLEHLLFNGTTTRTQKQLYDAADRLGAYNNATTREDHTLFTLLVAKEHAEEGLAIQADMLFRSTIPEENFEKERKIVLEELARDRSDPGYEIEAAFRAHAFAGTPIARPVLGTEASLGAITRAQVIAYYKARYVASNMTLVVMGDFAPDEMLAAVKRTFGAAPSARAPKPVASAWPAPPAAAVEVAAADPEPVRALAAFPFAAAASPRTFAAAEILLAAASDGDDSPLARALARRGVTAIESGLALARRRAPWSTVDLDAKLSGGAEPHAVLDALADAIRATRAGGDARLRLDRVLTRAVSDTVIARDQIHYFAMLHSDAILGSPAGMVGEEAALLASLGAADWDAASAALTAGLPMVRARLTGLGLTPQRLAWAPAAEPPAVAAGPSGPRAGTLPNGLRYVVAESGDSEVFAMHVAFAPRAAAEPPGRDGISDLLHRAIARATIVHGPASLDDRWARLGAHVKAFDDPSVPFDDYYTTPEFSWLRLEAPAAQWRESLSLLAEMIRFPTLTAESLEQARRDERDRVKRREASPSAAAGAALEGLLAAGHPFTRPVYGTDASLTAITLDELKAYHAAFAVGRRAIVSVVGPVGVEDVVRALEADLGALPAGDAPPAIAAAPVTSTASTTEVALGKSQSYLAIGALWDIPAEDRPALTIAIAMLSDRLAFDLRETQGLAYSISASLRPWGGRTRFEVDMGTRKENLERARSGILDGIKAFRESSPTDPDVERIVNTARGAALMRRMTRISLAYEAGLEALRGSAPGAERRFVDSLNAVHAADVKRVAQAYLDPDRLAVAAAR